MSIKKIHDLDVIEEPINPARVLVAIILFVIALGLGTYIVTSGKYLHIFNVENTQ